MNEKQAMDMLKTIKNLAEDASMCGAFSDGFELMISTYQKIRKVAIENEWVAADLVIDLDEEKEKHEISFGHLGVAAALFMGLLKN